MAVEENQFLVTVCPWCGWSVPFKLTVFQFIKCEGCGAKHLTNQGYFAKKIIVPKESRGSKNKHRENLFGSKVIRRSQQGISQDSRTSKRNHYRSRCVLGAVAQSRIRIWAHRWIYSIVGNAVLDTGPHGLWYLYLRGALDQEIRMSVNRLFYRGQKHMDGVPKRKESYERPSALGVWILHRRRPRQITWSRAKNAAPRSILR